MQQPEHASKLEAVINWIDAHREEAIVDLQRFCRQPSVATQNWGMEEMARMVVESLQQLGAETSVVATAGYPVIVGQLAGNSARRLAIYNHYDVQPAEPLEAWVTPPFDAAIRDGNLYARGVADNKGNLVARLWATRAWLETHGELPCQVTFLFEGEEEIGSTSLQGFAATHQDLVKADACLWESGSRNAEGQLTLNAGVKGILYVELRVRGLAYDIHSSNAPIAPNAAWRLIEALGTLRDPSGRVLIPHFYDDVLAPSEREWELMKQFPINGEALRQNWQASVLLGDSGDPAALTRRLLFEPTCNICGFWGGYTGEGSKTIIPAAATVKIDFRLVPNQDPQKIAIWLRHHLHNQGFDDIEVIELEEGERPAQSSVDTPLMEALTRAVRFVYSNEPRILPRTAGTGPMEMLCQRYGIPVVGGAGVGYYDSRGHSPNEHIRLEDFFLGIKCVSALLYIFGA